MAGRITYLSETDKAAIYEAALEIMETVGQRVHHPEALELIVIMDEYLSLNRRIFAGVEVSPETLAVDTIREVGPGGDFLSSKHTARHVRKAQWRPTIINRQGYVRWQEEGGLDLREKARRKALKLLETHQPEPLTAAVAARIDALVAGFVPGA